MFHIEISQHGSLWARFDLKFSMRSIDCKGMVEVEKRR